MLKFYDEVNVRLPVHKCKAPKFKDYGGRTWDYGRITINGKEVKAYLDTSWGEYIYFEWDGSWRKLKMRPDIMEELKLGKTWDVDPFGNPKLTVEG